MTLTSIFGTQLFERRMNANFIIKSDFDTEIIRNIGAGSELLVADELSEHRREAGIFTQQFFTYKDQYFLTLNLRRDYASVIGIDVPSIFYPGANFALRLDKYDFFPRRTAIEPAASR